MKFGLVCSVEVAFTGPDFSPSKCKTRDIAPKIGGKYNEKVNPRKKKTQGAGDIAQEQIACLTCGRPQFSSTEEKHRTQGVHHWFCF